LLFKKSQAMKYKYLFGPVPSRRLGVSLGVDLVPHKVCNLDCVYCEIGHTTKLTNDRMNYIPSEKVTEELDHYIANNPELDYVTFSGAGEPTLNQGIGKIVKHLKTNYPDYNIALITNSILFSNPEVRKEILDVDLILPSLDAASYEVFEKINRPQKNINYDEVINGLIDLRKEFAGEIWLEFFLIEGINDGDEELSKMKEIVTKINPDILQLNSLDRPGTESWVKPMPKEKMEGIKAFFQPQNTRIIARYEKTKHIENFDSNKIEAILNTIGRRPCTVKDLLSFIDINHHELNKYLKQLVRDNLIEKQYRDNLIFYIKAESR
jgi:wyosine [tRNA(Phe)-imidazoG37] synthetase (radical SAM superfamily)